MKEGALSKYMDMQNKNEVYEANFSKIDEIPMLLRESERMDKILLARGKKWIKIVGNIFSFRNILKLFKLSGKRQLIEKLSEDVRIKPEVLEGSLNEYYPRKLHISQLPVPKYYKEDAGPYLTTSIVTAKDPDTGFQNFSFHRILLKEEFGVIRIVEGRHLHQIYRKYQKKGKDMPVIIGIGWEPILQISAAMRPPYGVSELEIAGGLMGRPVPVIKDSDIMIPVSGEIVLKGYIKIDRYDDEWMTDILQLRDRKRRQPLFEIEEIRGVENPLFQVLLPGGQEHKNLMGIPVLPKIWNELQNQGIQVEDIHLTGGSGGWLHVAVAIEKLRDTDGKTAILSVFNAHPSAKGVIVVDNDIDVTKYEDMEFAVATRLRDLHKQLIYIRGIRGSSLDPSAKYEEPLKWGLDLTLPFEFRREDFKKANITGGCEDSGRVDK